MTPVSGSCANCAEPLAGEFCSRCGQPAIDYHRPLSDLFSDVVGDILNLDTRLIRTLRPLMFTPGAVVKDYIAGRRASHVPPLKSYLIAALIFFGLFTIFPSQAPVSVVEMGSAEERAAKANSQGGRTSISLPQHITFHDEWYQGVKARAMKQPEELAHKIYENVPRAFFVFLPVFAVFLKLLYRKQGFVMDHLVFSLYYHAFVFLNFSLFFLARQGGRYLPGPLGAVLGLGLFVWLVAYLPIALRRVYGGPRWLTGAKLLALGVLYFIAFLSAMPVIIGAALIQF